ncbi:MAG: hypothetical protein LUQ11_13705 [Methylococcaceae bacterium]|nr:hypothetical protein [Methylococcaceae bacterium]
MFKKTFISSLFVFGLSLSGAASAFNQYAITDLGSLAPGGANDFSYAFDINDRGDIVGFSKGADGLDHAFVRLAGQPMKDLGQGRATSINISRQVVGWGSGPNYLLWNKPGVGAWVSKDIGVGKHSYIDIGYRGPMIKINALGHAAGVGRTGKFFWKDGVATTVGGFTGCIPLSVVGLNNNDDVLYGDGKYMYVFHGATGQREVLSDGIAVIELNALNDAGEAVGLNTMDMTFGGTGYYSESTGYMHIPVDQSFWDINNSGLAVGGGDYNSYAASIDKSDFGVYSAVIYSSQDDSVAYLDTLIPNSGWQLKIATAISDRGFIVGVGINPAGKTHAFLLTPVWKP